MTQRFIATALLESKLVRVAGPVPKIRPAPTLSSFGRNECGYAASNNDGSDGAALTDYDIIGSAAAGTGLFALQQVERLSYLYIPPLTRERDVGSSTLVVAEKFCRLRHTMLIVDPPSAWRSADDAIKHRTQYDFRSSYAVMYFPRVIAMDRLRNRLEYFGNGGAVAGMLTRAEAQRPVWAMDAPEVDLIPRAGLRLAVALSESDRWRLTSHGVNALRATRNASIIRPMTRTLAEGAPSAADFGYLSAQRLACFIVGHIECGTYWVRYARSDPATWQRVTRQVVRFLNELTLLGAFPAAAPTNAFMVACDERTHNAADLGAQRTNIVIAFAGTRRGQYHGFVISQGRDATKVKSVAINALQLPLVIEPWLNELDDSVHGADTLAQVG